MIKVILSLSVIILMLFGCASNIQDFPDVTLVSELSTQPVYESISTPLTEPPTEPPTEYIPSFDIEPGTYLDKYTDESTTDYLEYYLFIPDNADFNMPMVVFLHGDGEVLNSKNLKNYGPVKAAKSIYGKEFPFVALYPCTRVYSWVDEPIPQTLMGLIEAVSERMTSDPDHIILTGHSRGSMGVWNMLSLYGDYFSAAVPVSCGPSTQIDYENVATVPIRAIVGTVGEDEINYGKSMRRTVNKLIELGADAELIYLWDLGHTHTSTEAFSQEMFEWMLSQ